MECAKINQMFSKIKLLFEKLVEPNYVMDNYYADDLLDKLSNHSDPEVEIIENTPLLSDLIIVTLDHIENVHITVKVFLIRILAVVSQKELQFPKIFSKKGDKILEGFKQINTPILNPGLRVAYLETALAAVKHVSGISWLLESGVWKEILSLCNQKTTVFVVRQTYKFMAEFLWALDTQADLTNMRVVISCLIEPINRVELINFQTLTTEEFEEITNDIEPVLHILICIVSKHDCLIKPTALINMLIHEFKITTYLTIACDRLRREEVCLLLMKLIFSLMVGKCFLNKPMLPGVLYKREDFLEVSAFSFNIIQCFLRRRNANLVLDFCMSCNIIWHTICKDREPGMWKPGDEMTVKLRNQMLIISLVPILVFLKKDQPSQSMNDELLNEFITSLLNASCEYTAKAAYSLRDLIENLDVLPITLQSVKKLNSLRDYVNDEQANLVFQALFYVLQKYTPANPGEELNMLYDECQEKDLVMTYVMNIVLSLVKYHNINWHESLEVISLYSVVYDVLQRPNLSCKFVVTSLNVIATSIKKFLPPNLSLLIEVSPGSQLHAIGKLIYMKMNDAHWEVRDTALELLHICTDMAYIKFPPFQKIIIADKLINVAATIAFNDFESYVQVSALKCIGAASRIPAIWDQLLDEYPDAQVRLISILRNNEEGIVRRESCNVLCNLYQNMKQTTAFKQALYEHMASSALSDFHWEVQLSAIKFWKCVYLSLLTNQGMLDGSFPPVTFSKESRKIVTLNEAEIQRRLIKILQELSAIGCLTVFVKLIHDETEVEIMDATLSTALNLLDILYKYKVPDYLKPKEGEPESAEELLCHIKEDNYGDDLEMDEIENPENVIEDILKADDVNLLANIYERHMTLENNKTEKPLKPKLKLLKYASPYLFVNFFKNSNYKQVIEEKRKWNIGIRSVSSLLDDILGLYEVNQEANCPDCY